MSPTMSLLLKNAHKLYGFPQSVNIFVENSIINTCRSSRSQVFFKIGVLKNSKYSQENTCVGVSFFIKFIKHRAFNFIKIETPTQVFSCEFAKFLRTKFFIEYLRWLLLYLASSYIRMRIAMSNNPDF